MKPVNVFRKTVIGVIFLLAALMISGCATTWVQRAPEWQPKKNVRVLVGHYSVSSDGGADLFDLGKQAAGGISFGDVSMETYKLMVEALKTFDMTLVTDKKRAKKLNHTKELTSGNDKVDALVGSLASKWTHPATASNPFHRIMAGTKLRKQVVDTLKRKDKNEVFLSADLKIEDQDQYLVFKRFRLTLAIQILNQKGEAVFQAKTEGFTGLSFLRNPISEKRIQTAMAQALGKLEKAPVENKISTISSL
jgi:hypothetical protein